MKTTKDKYSDFTSFIIEVSREHDKKKILSKSWLWGITDCLGAYVSFKIIGNANPKFANKYLSIARSLEDMARNQNLIMTNQIPDEMLEGFIDNAFRRDRKAEYERINKSEIIYNELLQYKDSKSFEKSINNLFKDLVNGKDILY